MRRKAAGGRFSLHSRNLAENPYFDCSSSRCQRAARNSVSRPTQSLLIGYENPDKSNADFRKVNIRSENGLGSVASQS
jgi:hypothetical protein